MKLKQIMPKTDPVLFKKKLDIILLLKEPDVNYISHNQFLKLEIHQFYKEQNWKGLIYYIKRLIYYNELPQTWRWQLPQAYIYNNELEKAFDLLYMLHQNEPQNPDIQITILEYLLKAGVSINHFSWISPVNIHPVEKKYHSIIFRFCSQFLNGTSAIILNDYLKLEFNIQFDIFDLLWHLKQDDNFFVFNPYENYRQSIVQSRL